ncbi:hypothetical protein F53441_6662 [Fusarium austroafricanum]|uniref:Uncharacterized protein n=1 Tax=Fusarium austroafricanum TaxID=2364996 RepID=A0A8H4NZB1_9HYPO|nr:hypothetical protein F53441_6662 [Fusarium austroafricanum]
MGSSSLPSVPSPPRVAPLHAMTVEQLLHFLQERSHLLTLENERLRPQYEFLQASVDQKEAMLKWQQRLICLGEEHVALLERVLQGQSTETALSTESPPQFMEHQFRQQTCSSPLNTPPNLRLESNQVGDSTSFAAGVSEDDYRQDITQDNLEAIQRCTEEEALAYLASYC